MSSSSLWNSSLEIKMLLDKASSRRRRNHECDRMVLMKMSSRYWWMSTIPLYSVSTENSIEKVELTFDDPPVINAHKLYKVSPLFSQMNRRGWKQPTMLLFLLIEPPKRGENSERIKKKVKSSGKNENQEELLLQNNWIPKRKKENTHTAEATMWPNPTTDMILSTNGSQMSNGQITFPIEFSEDKK